MNSLLRLIVVGGLVVAAILLIALGLARDSSALSAPAHLLLFIMALAVYLLPTSLAFYRDSKSAAWITVVNILLGWTVFGWFVAIGWAAGGKVRELPPPVPMPPTHAETSH